MMLALRPELVDMTRATNFPSSSQARAQAFPILGNGRSAKLGWQMQDYNAAGAVGNAAAATADKGRAVVAASARSLAELLIEIDRLPADTLNHSHPD
jgi:creatinine amidohydrolase